MDSSCNHGTRAEKSEARWLAIRRPVIKENQTDDAEDDVRRPGRGPGGNARAFAKGEEEVHDEVHRENQKDRCGNTGQNPAPGIAYSERSGDQGHTGTAQRTR